MLIESHNIHFRIAPLGKDAEHGTTDISASFHLTKHYHLVSISKESHIPVTALILYLLCQLLSSDTQNEPQPTQ